MIRKLGIQTLNALATWRVRGRFEELKVGCGSDVLIWRFRGAGKSRLVIGESCFVRDKIYFERPGATVTIGDRTFLGNGLIAVANRVSIGSDVMFGWGVTVVDHDSHDTEFAGRKGDTERWLRGEKDWSNVKVSPVRVEDKAWIGFDACILKGVTVGEGSVVAAKSVVTRDVAPWTVVGGNPARVIRTLNSR